MDKRKTLQRIAASIAAGVSPWMDAGAAQESGSNPDWSLSTRALGVALLRQASAGQVVVSPLSLWGGLAMLHAGARGATAREIAQALRMPDKVSAFVRGWQAIRATQQQSMPQLQWHVANRVWVQVRHPIVPAYEQVLQQGFAADLARIDFERETEQARLQINRWTEQQTSRMIRDLLAPGALTSLTRLVLTQAVYLKADWLEAFDPAMTRPDVFELASGQKVQVPFMHQTATHLVGTWQRAEVSAQWLELPYAGDRLRMVLCIPQRAEHLPNVLDLLQDSTRVPLLRRPVSLSLPRWKARSSLSLQQSLKNLGIRRAFAAGQADLSGMDGRRDLSVDAVLHEAHVDVSERGTEAAAATAVTVTTRAMPQQLPPLEIRADRPFAWAVVDPRSRAMWFAGVVRDPS